MSDYTWLDVFLRALSSFVIVLGLAMIFGIGAAWLFRGMR